MSDSDDTDELLLMTPLIEDHIVEQSEVPYYEIVDKLITQVSKLKSRITSIENSSDVSLGSLTSSMDTFFNMQSNDSNNTCRRCISFENLHGADQRRNTIPTCFSTQSTPQKPRSKLMLKSFPNSPKHEGEFKFKKHNACKSPRAKIIENEIIRESEVNKKPLTEETNIINEIDQFLSNIKPLRSAAVRTLDFNRPSREPSKTAVDVHQIFEEMDKQEEKIKNLYENQTNSMTTNSSENISSQPSINEWRRSMETMSSTSTDSSSVTDKCTVLFQPTGKKNEFISRRNNEKTSDNHFSTHVSNDNSEIKNLAENILKNSQTSRSIRENSRQLSSFLKQRNDIHSNAKDAITMHQKLLGETNSPEFNSYHDPTRKLMNPVSDQRLGGVSLIDLWTSEKREAEENSEKCIQRLQEEKLRRTHCEELIQQLQNKILEQQEKLAVAIQVDEAKDNAILRFHDAWEKASIKFKLVVQERGQLENEVQNLVGQNKKIAEECEEKIDFHRKETNQVLNLLHEHKMKVEELDKKLEATKEENETLKNVNKELEEKVAKEEEKNKQLSNILANKELELNESRNILLHAKKEMSQCQITVEMCQKDFAELKTENEILQEEKKIEKNNNSKLQEDNKNLQEELESERKKEKLLLSELKEVRDKLESNKRELRNFYQGQVELLVQNKLKEFQKQLDEAEQKMKDQLGRKELEIAKSASSHIQQISEKYTLEINLIEQKHQEEMQLKQVKIAQLEQKLYEVQGRLDKQQDKKSDLIKQLQKVMEIQWAEALRIINNGKSPAPLDDSSGTMDQLQSLQSRSYQNMEALLSGEFDDKGRVQNHQGARENSGQSKRKNQHMKENHGQRDSGKTRGSKQHDDGQLQRYINMLLHKQPGDSAEGKERINSSKFFNDQPTTDSSTWQRTAQDRYVTDLQENQNEKDINRRKTSWK